MNASKPKPADEPADEQQTSTDPSDPSVQAPEQQPEPSAGAPDPDVEPGATIVEGEVQTCAACGETAVFTEHSTIGSVALDYHSCADAAALVHDYAVKSIRDHDYPLPQLAS